MMFDYYQPQGKVMFSEVSVSYSVHNRPHYYAVTAHHVDTHPTRMLSCSLFSYKCRVLSISGYEDDGGK